MNPSRWFGARPDHAPAPPARVPDGVRAYVIGDIHGRADLLDRTHAWIEQDWEASSAQQGVVVYVGDYVDRGRDAAGVIDRLSGGAPRGIIQRFLMGNHEEMLLKFLDDPAVGPAWSQIGGLETLLSYQVDVNLANAQNEFDRLSKRFAELLPSSHRTFLECLELSVTLGDYFICHAGVRPGVPLEDQRSSDLLWIRNEFLKSTADFGKVVIHGHTPVAEPDIRPNRINIDTGAYATGHLCCLALEGSERRFVRA
jgi:serine/threonine protein phosphatase 1